MYSAKPKLAKRLVFFLLAYLASKTRMGKHLDMMIYLDIFLANNFEAMNAGKLTIQPRLSFPSNENMLVDLPSSVLGLNE